jgi:hypothetical protein
MRRHVFSLLIGRGWSWQAAGAMVFRFLWHSARACCRRTDAQRTGRRLCGHGDPNTTDLDYSTTCRNRENNEQSD